MQTSPIQIQRLLPNTVVLTVIDEFRYDDLFKAVGESILLMTDAVHQNNLVLNFAGMESKEVGVMSALFRVSEMLDARVGQCVIVAAPMIVQEAVIMITRVNPKMQGAVCLADSLAEALLILDADKRSSFTPN